MIDGSRRQRIARGSGTSVQQVNQLLEGRKQMAKLMKGMSKGKLPALGPDLAGANASKPGRPGSKSRKKKKRTKSRR